MKINEILVESTQLDEGPFSDVAKKVGTGVGKAVGGVAKGVGAVAGGIAGIGKAVKKGYQAGKATVAGDDEADDTTGQSQPAGTSTPQASTGTAPSQKTSATPQASAKSVQPQANQANQTVYAQVKANIDKLDKKGKQRILNLLQKSLGQPAASAPVTTATQTATQTKQANFTPAGSTQTAGIQRSGKLVAESFSIYRKR
jgi:hypothetical protein